MKLVDAVGARNNFLLPPSISLSFLPSACWWRVTLILSSSKHTHTDAAIWIHLGFRIWPTDTQTELGELGNPTKNNMLYHLSHSYLNFQLHISVTLHCWRALLIMHRVKLHIQWVWSQREWYSWLSSVSVSSFCAAGPPIMCLICRIRGQNT